MSLPEGTVVSMHHPEEEEEDDDEFLSDDAEVGQHKDKTKQKGACCVKQTSLQTSEIVSRPGVLVYFVPSSSFQPRGGGSRGTGLRLEGQQPGRHGGRGAAAVSLG